jgi:hypothetical protein
MEAYSSLLVWTAIVVAGVAGCLGTSSVAKAMRGVPFAAVGGNWAKHAWSIIFCVPVPFLLGLPIGIALAFLWLVLVPTIASKAYFGPKDLPAMTLNTFHLGYAIVALIVYHLVLAVG